MTQEDDSFASDKGIEKNDYGVCLGAIRMQVRMYWTGNDWIDGENFDKSDERVLSICQYYNRRSRGRMTYITDFLRKC